MIISFRNADGRQSLIDESKLVGSFSLVFKAQSGEVLVTPKWYTDIYNRNPEDLTGLDLQNLRSALTTKFQLNNYRLYYIDDENDQIPIDEESELQEAVKFANQNRGTKSVILIIANGEKTTAKSPQKPSTKPCLVFEKTTEKMPPMRVETTPARAAASPSVTAEFVARVAAAAAASATVDLEKDMPPMRVEPTPVPPSIAAEFAARVAAAAAASATVAQEKNMPPMRVEPAPTPAPVAGLATLAANSASRAVADYARLALGRNMSARPTAVPTPAKPDEEAMKWFKDFLESYKKEIVAEVTKEVVQKLTSALAPETAETSASRISDYTIKNLSQSDRPTNERLWDMYYSMTNPLSSHRVPPFRQPAMPMIPPLIPPPPPPPPIHLPQPCHNVPLYGPPPMMNRFPRYPPFPISTKAPPPTSDQKTAKDLFPPIFTRNGYMNVPIAKDDATTEKLHDMMEKLHVNVHNQQDAEGAGPSGISKPETNEKQTKSDSDNISILSDHSHMSEFLIEDDDFPQDPSRNSDSPRRESYSSFELVSESTPEDTPSPEKKAEKPGIYVNVSISNEEQGKNSVGVDAQGKVYNKNIVETPEEDVIDPELDKRPGGAYSFVASTLPDPREDISREGASKPEKSFSYTEYLKDLDAKMKTEEANKQRNANSGVEIEEVLEGGDCNQQYATFGTQNGCFSGQNGASSQYTTFCTQNSCFNPQNNVNAQYTTFGAQNSSFDAQNGACGPKPKAQVFIDIIDPRTGQKINHQYTASSSETKTETKSKEKKAGTPRVVKIKQTKSSSTSPRGSRVVIDHNVSKGLGDTKKSSPKAKPKVTGQQQQQSSSQGTQSQSQTHSHSHSHSQSQSQSQFPYGYPQYPPSFNANSSFAGQSGYPYYEQWSGSQPFWRSQYPYDPYNNDYMQILPEPLISGALQAASSAYTTARKVLEKIRNPLLEGQGEPKPPQS